MLLADTLPPTADWCCKIRSTHLVGHLSMHALISSPSSRAERVMWKNLICRPINQHCSIALNWMRFVYLAIARHYRRRAFCHSLKVIWNYHYRSYIYFSMCPYRIVIRDIICFGRRFSDLWWWDLINSSWLVGRWTDNWGAFIIWIIRWISLLLLLDVQFSALTQHIYLDIRSIFMSVKALLLWLSHLVVLLNLVEDFFQNSFKEVDRFSHTTL